MGAGNEDIAGLPGVDLPAVQAEPGSFLFSHDGLCQLTARHGVASLLCATLRVAEDAESAGHPRVEARALHLYLKGVAAQIGRTLTRFHAAVLALVAGTL